MSEPVYDVWLSLHTGPGNRLSRDLCEIFGGAAGVHAASDDEIRLACGTGGGAAALADRDLGRAAEILLYCERAGVRVLTEGSPDYPAPLGMIQDPPRLLYVRGSLPDPASSPYAGVVGTRRMSVYGMETAFAISYGLAAAGCTVVSGLARGIDGAAAAAALEAGGTTVAVIGTGIDTAYPPEHAALMEAVAARGAVVSEYPPGSGPEPSHFPARNRIISWLSRAVLVVEAGYSSVAWITARLALEQGRRLFAVPGRVGDPGSYGTNRLLRSGASVAIGAEDLLEAFEEESPGCVDRGAFAAAAAGLPDAARALARYGVLVPGPSESDGAGERLRKGGRLYCDPPGSAPGGPAFEKAGEKAGDPSGEASGGAGEARERRLPPEGRMRDFWSLIPDGGRVSADFFPVRGYSGSDAMNLLSMLEISGFVAGVPGGMYEKI